MAFSRPELQLRVALRGHAHHQVVALLADLEAVDDLGVTAVEALRQPEQRREDPDDTPPAAIERAEVGVRLLRRALAVVPGDERDDRDLLRFEAPEVAVGDEVVRVPVMALVPDVRPDVVEQ